MRIGARSVMVEVRVDVRSWDPLDRKGARSQLSTNRDRLSGVSQVARPWRLGPDPDIRPNRRRAPPDGITPGGAPAVLRY